MIAINLGRARARIPKEEGDFYSAYAVFARTLRAWLIAYGVGAPLAFFQAKEAWAAMGAHGELRPFVYLFLAGIGIQILSAFLYKTAMWYSYMDELAVIERGDIRVRVSNYVATAYWLEALLDLATITCFAIATVRALRMIVG